MTDVSPTPGSPPGGDAEATPPSGVARMIADARLVPPAPGQRRPAQFASAADYLTYMDAARRDPDGYWAGVALELDWFSPWQTLREGTLPDFRYYVGGCANVSHNCLDRHVAGGRSNKAAIIWEGEDGAERVLTYQMLLDEVSRFANVLADLGVRRGDVVAIYMSNIPEVFAAVHACYRLGAVYTVIFAGFSAEAVGQRLRDCRPKVVVVADGSQRRGRVLPLKATLDDALGKAADFVEHVVVVRHTGAEVAMHPDRDRWYHELMSEAAPTRVPEAMEANEPGFIIYTSGTEARPKGVVHSGLGFLVGTYANVKWSLDLRDDDVYWCTADVGWLTFPIFALVGGLAHGATLVVYEGSLDFPGPDRFYDIVARHRVNKVFTAPTALRMLRRFGTEALRGHDLSRLELISLVGEPLDPETWYWVRDNVGGGSVCINNTYGQTETATAWTSSVVGVTAGKPGSCGQPLPGYASRVLDAEGHEVPPGQPGYLVITEPFPSLMRTVWGDHNRYLSTYFSRFPGTYFTADTCVVDRDGHYWVIGRVDDVINVAGHRLSTMEMEAALLNHPLVSEAAVIGVDDPLKGLLPVAFVVLRGGAENRSDMESELSEQIVVAIGGMARPGRVYVVPALPKTRSGKIMRRLLREILSTGEARGDTSALENADSIKVLLELVRT